MWMTENDVQSLPFLFLGLLECQTYLHIFRLCFLHTLTTNNKINSIYVRETPCLLNYETPHLGLRFYHISKLTCTIIILTTSYKFLLYLLYWRCTLVFIVFLNFILLLCFVLVVYCGAPVPRMRGALANDMIWYEISPTQSAVAGTKMS